MPRFTGNSKMTRADLEKLAKLYCDRCAKGMGMLGRNRYIHTDMELCRAFDVRRSFDLRQEANKREGIRQDP